MTLLQRVERTLRQNGMTATRFGREVASDPRLVHDMRKGRTIGKALQQRIESHLGRVER